MSDILDEADLEELLLPLSLDGVVVPVNPNPDSSLILTLRLLDDRDTDNRFEDGDPSVDSLLSRLRTDEDDEAGEGGSGIECQVGKRYEGNGKERSV